MNRLEDRIERDLRQIADRATPSPDAWNTILARIADQEPDTETEIIMLTEATPRTTRRWLLLASAAAAVGAIIAAAVIAFAVNTSDDEQTPVPQATLAPTTVPTTTVAPTTTEPGCPNTFGGLCRGSLAAGTYTTNMFAPVITYTVPDGWFNNQDIGGHFDLWPVNTDVLSPTYSFDTLSGDTRAIGIFEGLAIPDGCAQQPDPSVDRTVDAMTQWLTSHPGLVTSQPEPVTIGGLEGVLIDVSLDPAWTQTCPWSQGQPVVQILVDGIPNGFAAGIDPGKPVRLYLLEHATGVIVIDVSASNRGPSIDDLAAMATPILENIHFAP